MDLEKVAGIAPAVDEAAVAVALASAMSDRDPLYLPSWRITSVGAADWALQRYRDAAERRQDYLDEVEMWRRAALRMGQVAQWFEDRLKEWALSERTESRKTFPLAHGTVSTRSTAPRPMVADEATAIAWAKVNCPDAVQTVESFLISRADAVVNGDVVIHRATGEVIPGLAVAPEQVTASVTPAGL